MYATTCRQPSEKTKKFARLLAKLLPASVFENRGKKTIDGISERARRLGQTRALIVSEAQGKPAGMDFIEASADWKWLEPRVMIKKIEKASAPSEKLEEGIAAGNADVANLFDFPPAESDELVFLKAGKNSISIRHAKKEMLLMKVAYIFGK